MAQKNILVLPVRWQRQKQVILKFNRLELWWKVFWARNFCYIIDCSTCHYIKFNYVQEPNQELKKAPWKMWRELFLDRIEEISGPSKGSTPFLYSLPLCGWLCKNGLNNFTLELKEIDTFDSLNILSISPILWVLRL